MREIVIVHMQNSIERRDLLKLCLIALGIAGGYRLVPFYFARIEGDALISGEWLRLTIVLVTIYASTVALTFVAGWIRSPSMRWIVASVFAMSTGFVIITITASSFPPTFDAVATAIDSRAAAVDFATLNVPLLFGAALFSAATLLGIGWPPRQRRSQRLAFPVVIVAVAALGSLAASNRSWAISAAAPAWSGTAFAGLVLLDQAMHPDVVAPPPAIRPRQRSSGGDIILIVDESIGGHYLDLNRTTGVRSGLVPAPAGVDVVNFGIATAATNFSVGTNFILRTGGTRQAYLKRSASIWAYAHRAGYRTVHIFAQDYPGLQNLMSPAERAQIDNYITMDGIDLTIRDHLAADILKRHFRNGIREFIYVNKVGAHSPAWQFYPPAQTRYRPTLSERQGRSTFMDVRKPDDWFRYRNDYRNAVAWNVGRFFDRLLSAGLPTGTTIIYTSDHGEGMNERGIVGRYPHANFDNPLPEEGSVPLVSITSAGAGSWWAAAARANHGESHYRIFPTVLRLMGYAPAEVSQRFGPDMLSDQPDPMTFNSHFYTRFGTVPAWHQVLPDRIITPN